MVEERHPKHPTPAPSTGHEVTDAEIRPILFFLAGLGGFLLISMLAMTWLFNFLNDRYQTTQPQPSPMYEARQLPPQPRLQSSPALDYRRYFEEEQKRLDTYGWVDETTGVFRIPIDRAMDIIAEQGLPYRHAPAVEEEPEETPSTPKTVAEQ